MPRMSGLQDILSSQVGSETPPWQVSPYIVASGGQNQRDCENTLQELE